MTPPHAAPPPNEEGTTRVELNGFTFLRTKEGPWLMEYRKGLWHPVASWTFLDRIADLEQQLAAARAETERLRQLLTRMEEYTRHEEGCSRERRFGAHPCDCGLKWLRDEMDPPNAPPAAKETKDE